MLPVNSVRRHGASSNQAAYCFGLMIHGQVWLGFISNEQPYEQRLYHVWMKDEEEIEEHVFISNGNALKFF